jgi:cysteine desulfurase
MDSIYLDYNATTPIDREVADAMAPYLYEHFGNPSSSHPYGATTKCAVELARSQVARDVTERILALGPNPVQLKLKADEHAQTFSKGMA